MSNMQQQQQQQQTAANSSLGSRAATGTRCSLPESLHKKQCNSAASPPVQQSRTSNSRSQRFSKSHNSVLSS